MVLKSSRICRSQLFLTWGKILSLCMYLSNFKQIQWVLAELWLFENRPMMRDTDFWRFRDFFVTLTSDRFCPTMTLACLFAILTCRKYLVMKAWTFWYLKSFFKVRHCVKGQKTKRAIIGNLTVRVGMDHYFTPYYHTYLIVRPKITLFSL